MQATAVQKTYTSGFQYSCTSLYAKQYTAATKNVTAAALCQAPQDYNKGSALVAYNSTSFYDDLLWSSAWLWHLTGVLTTPTPLCCCCNTPCIVSCYGSMVYADTVVIQLCSLSMNVCFPI